MTYYPAHLTELISARASFYMHAHVCGVPQFVAGAILQLEIDKAAKVPSDTVFDAIERARRKLVE